MVYSQQMAETLALRALEWLVARDDLLPVFLGSTGATEADVHENAGDPVFLGAVLDFLMMDDTWITAFCDALEIPYEHPFMARQALPGGSEVHWT